MVSVPASDSPRMGREFELCRKDGFWGGSRVLRNVRKDQNRHSLRNDSGYHGLALYYNYYMLLRGEHMNHVWIDPIIYR